jgi:hypothetical protein
MLFCKEIGFFINFLHAGNDILIIKVVECKLNCQNLNSSRGIFFSVVVSKSEWLSFVFAVSSSWEMWDSCCVHKDETCN